MSALRLLPLVAVERIELPVTAHEAWDLLGDPRRLTALVSTITSAELLPNGFRVSMAGTATTAQFEHRVPQAGLVATYAAGSLFGLRIPAPELDAAWVLIDPLESAVSVEFGRAFQFRNRLAQQAGRALVPLHQKVLQEMTENAVRILAPGWVVEGLAPPSLAAETTDTARSRLSATDAHRLSESKLRGHKAAAIASGFGIHSRDPFKQRLGEAGLKATAWHADRTARQRHQNLVEGDDWPQLLERLISSLAPHLATPRDDDVTRTLVAGCRESKLTARDDIVAGLGIAAFGFAVCELETKLYGPRTTRRLRRFMQEVMRINALTLEGQIGRGALAIATGTGVERQSVPIFDLAGFSSDVHEMLIDAAGRAVDTSPDVPKGRSSTVRRKTETLFFVGWATHAMLELGATRSQ